MSTQASLRVPFSLVHPQQNVRLLELPPELLKIVEDTSSRVVQLKSAAPTTSRTSTTPKDQPLHLCTESHVWAVRQVSTSNSVHVLAPTSSSSSAANNPTDAGPGVAAFAQPTSTLELLPAPYTAAEIDAAIHRLLAVHPDPSQSSKSVPLAPSISAQELDASLPYPHAAVAQATRRCFVFEASDGQVYVPSPALLLAAWRAFVDYAAIQRISLASFDLVGLGGVLSQIAVDEGPLLPAVIRAIAAEFQDGGERMAEAQDRDERERASLSLAGSLKGREVTKFVGALLVQCATGQQVDGMELIASWQNLVPTEWWKWCEVQELAETCDTGLGGMVQWRGKEENELGAATLEAKDAGPAPVASGPGKRNWHEKFAAQRKR